MARSTHVIVGSIDDEQWQAGVVPLVVIHPVDSTGLLPGAEQCWPGQCYIQLASPERCPNPEPLRDRSGPGCSIVIGRKRFGFGFGLRSGLANWI